MSSSHKVTTPAPRDRPDRRWLLFAVPALVTAVVVAGPYVTFSFHRVPLNPAVPIAIVFLSLHGLASGTALLLGPLQFVRRIRVMNPQVHRTIGGVYLVAVLVGGVMALAATIVSESGWTAQVGFVVLDAFWLYTAFRALRTAQQRHFAEHRIWMIRNYSATFAAVLLRIILAAELAIPPRFGVRLPFADAYNVSVWGSITLSIFVAELFIVERSTKAVLPPPYETPYHRGAKSTTFPSPTPPRPRSRVSRPPRDHP